MRMCACVKVIMYICVTCHGACGSVTTPFRSPQELYRQPSANRIVEISFLSSFFWREPRRLEDVAIMSHRYIKSMYI